MEAVLLDPSIDSVSHRLLAHLDRSSILRLRGVCKRWKAVVETYPHFQTRFEVDCAIPADTSKRE